MTTRKLKRIKQLIRNVQKTNSGESWNELFDQYSALIRFSIQGYQSHQYYTDIHQEANYAFIKTIKKLRLSLFYDAKGKQAIANYLITAIKNHIMDVSKLYSAMRAYTKPIHFVETELKDAIDTLDPRSQTIIKLIIDGNSEEYIGKTFRVSKQQINKDIKNIISALKIAAL